MPDFGKLPHHWRVPLASLTALVLATIWLYRDTAWGMATIWSERDTYTHGFVVPLISAWLVWRMRHALAPMLPRPSPWAWALMLGPALLWLAGDLVAVNAASQAALMAQLVLCVPAVLGWQATRAMAFPLGFLFFAVPVGDFMLPQLVEWTADFTVAALRLSGVPVYRDGQHFVIPSGSWSVVEGCSGIRYLIASVTVGTLFAYLSYKDTKRRLMFVGVSIVVPLVANWLRAYMIVMIGHLSNNQLAVGVDHIIYGWLFFGVVILVMLFIGARWADAPQATLEPADAMPGVSRMPTGPSLGRSSLIAMTVALLVVASPHLARQALALGTNPEPVQLAPVRANAPWQSVDSPPSDWVPAFQHASASAHAGYLGPQGQQVGLHLSYYRQQDRERKLVSSVNLLVQQDDPHWALASEGSAQATLAGTDLRVSETILRQWVASKGSGGQRLLLWRFYEVNDRFTASDVRAKLEGVRGLLGGEGDDGAIVVVYTALRTDLTEVQAVAAGRAVLQDFLHSQAGSLKTALAQTQEAP
ncbi:MAG: exosortase A [Hydrogenophaga sp.]|uniref:exosortase A n=1 Tax=Hydrogenophaga sp. TaxID=1904254 RepID=UPI003D0A4914